MLAQHSMHLSKAYDCISHDLLIAKLEAYGLDKTNLYLLIDYLSNWEQRIKRRFSFRNRWNIICGISQGSVLGLLLFNIFIKNMLFFVSKSDISNFPEDNTISSFRKIFGAILHDIGNVLKWLKLNSLKPNPGKFQFMILATNSLS